MYIIFDQNVKDRNSLFLYEDRNEFLSIMIVSMKKEVIGT